MVFFLLFFVGKYAIHILFMVLRVLTQTLETVSYSCLLLVHLVNSASECM